MIDIVPTILEATRHTRARQSVDGIKQAPIEGTSLAYTFDAANADAPTRHTTQYFEMMGDHAIYHDGWLLSTKVIRAPWEAFGPANPDPLNNVTWELYNLNEDYSQTNDLAAPESGKGRGAEEGLPTTRPRSTMCCRSMPRWRRASWRRGPTSRRAAAEFVYTHPWSACRRATRRCCSTPPIP